MRIAIVEDEPQCLQNAKDCLAQWSKETEVEVNITHYSKGEDFVMNYQLGSFDLVFLDIRLPGMSGLEVAERLRQKDENVYLVFFTSLAQFAVEGYKYQAQDYFLKPITYYGIKLRMDRIKEKLDKENQEPFIPISHYGDFQKVPLKDILYIETQGHGLLIHTKKESFETRDITLGKLEVQLKDKGFSRCNACYLVNLAFVEGIDGFDVTVGDNVLTISRSRKTQFVHDFSTYLSRGA